MHSPITSCPQANIGAIADKLFEMNIAVNSGNSSQLQEDDTINDDEHNGVPLDIEHACR